MFTIKAFVHHAFATENVDTATVAIKYYINSKP